MDPETAHHFALDQLATIPPQVLRLVFGPAPAQPREVFGITFPNPIGLAAGMDKNATSLAGWEALGFGFVEIGTITAHAQPGNPKPRIFRYPPLGALVNRMGFNNDGSEEVARRLTRLKEAGEWPRIPVGVNIGKSKITPLEGAPEDYLTSFRRLRAFGDYFRHQRQFAQHPRPAQPPGDRPAARHRAGHSLRGHEDPAAGENRPRPCRRAGL